MSLDPISITGDTTMPSTTDPAVTTTDMHTDTYDPTIPPMPPSPKAEPFHPATTVPASATAPTPRERAYTLHLQGYRSPAIAAHLRVPERTIRYWIQQINQDLNTLPTLPTLDALDTLAATDQQEQQADVSPDPDQPTPTTTPTPLTTLQAQRTLAIERHRARSAAAWALHDQLRATLDPFLARVSERLLLHTQYPDDADPVSMSTLELAGGPVAPAFRAMYQLLPGIINGLTRSLALAERADLQVDRLQGIIPPATQPSVPASTSTPPAKQPAEPLKPRPTREEFARAVQARRDAERDAEDDAYIASLTPRQRHLLRLYASMPAKLPDGPADTWDIKIDPNVDIRGLRFPLPHIHHHDDDDDDADLHPTPTPPAHRPTGKPSGNDSGNPGNKSGNKIGNPSGNRAARQSAPTSPRGPFPRREGGRGLGSGNKSGNHSGNPGNATVIHPSPTSPRGPFPRREGGRGLGTAGF